MKKNEYVSPEMEIVEIEMSGSVLLEMSQTGGTPEEGSGDSNEQGM